MVKPVRLANTDDDFKKAGLERNHIHPSEDGKRMDPDQESYEWWYYDALLDDGSKLVITYYAKSIVNPKPGARPFVELEWTHPDGSKDYEKLDFEAADFKASEETCDVTIGKNYFKGDLHHYEIGFFGNKYEATIKLDGITPAWRPEIGILFGQEESIFGWLPSVPRGSTEVQITKKGDQTVSLKGSGYHDHNWGNVPLMKVMNHWYWGRANIDDYTVINSYMFSEKAYGHKEIPVFLLARNEEILADNTDFMTYTEDDQTTEPVTGRTYYKKLVYDYNDQKNHYKVTYTVENVITHDKMIDQISGFKKFLAKLVGFNGAYLRFSGKVALDIYNQAGEITDHHETEAVWEMADFGKDFKEENLEQL
ncbi:hypothetical protein OZX60_04915 [Streptococcaceae bacterium ESL0687]|nr:hypothetical protein OZX60_04915 [Streptococcaceae bacterium ESL0687]